MWFALRCSTLITASASLESRDVSPDVEDFLSTCTYFSPSQTCNDS